MLHDWKGLFSKFGLMAFYFLAKKNICNLSEKKAASFFSNFLSVSENFLCLIFFGGRWRSVGEPVKSVAVAVVAAGGRWRGGGGISTQATHLSYEQQTRSELGSVEEGQ